MLTISLKSLTKRVTEKVLEHLCKENPERRLKIDTQKQLVIMSPNYVFNKKS